MPKDPPTRKRTPTPVPPPVGKSMVSTGNRGGQGSAPAKSKPTVGQTAKSAASNGRQQTKTVAISGQSRSSASASPGKTVVAIPEATTSQMATAQRPSLEPPPGKRALVKKDGPENGGRVELQASVLYERTRSRKQSPTPPTAKASEVPVSRPKESLNGRSKSGPGWWQRRKDDGSTKIPAPDRSQSIPAEQSRKSEAPEPKSAVVSSKDVTSTSWLSKIPGLGKKEQKEAPKTASKTVQTPPSTKKPKPRATFDKEIKKETTPHDAGDYDFVVPMSHNDRVLVTDGVPIRVEFAAPVAIARNVEHKAQVVTKSKLLEPPVVGVNEASKPGGITQMEEPPRRQLPVKRRILKIDADMVPVKVGDTNSAQVRIEQIHAPLQSPVVRDPVGVERQIESLQAPSVIVGTVGKPPGIEVKIEKITVKPTTVVERDPVRPPERQIRAVTLAGVQPSPPENRISPAPSISGQPPSPWPERLVLPSRPVRDEPVSSAKPVVSAPAITDQSSPWPERRVLPSRPVSDQPVPLEKPSSPEKRIDSVPPVRGQPSAPPVRDQPLSPQVPCQPSIPPVRAQPSTPPVSGQPSMPPVRDQPSVPPVHGQPSTPHIRDRPLVRPGHGKPSTPPVPDQPSVPPVHGQPLMPPAREQPSVPPVHGQPFVAPVGDRPSMHAVHYQPPSPPEKRIVPVAPVPPMPWAKRIVSILPKRDLSPPPEIRISSSSASGASAGSETSSHGEIEEIIPAGLDIHQFIVEMMHPLPEVPIDLVSENLPKEKIQFVFVSSDGKVIEDTKREERRG